MTTIRQPNKENSVEKRLGTKENIRRLTDEIPVVDFSALSLGNKDPSVKTLKSLLIKFIKRLVQYGFVYLKNHGILQEVVSEPSFLRVGRRGCHHE